jgi:hypothetical protein
MTEIPPHVDGQLGLFDAPEGRRRRDAALERVDRNAVPEWKIAALEAVTAAARARPEFIVDEVWRFLPADVPGPREGRAMGPVMLQARRDGVITATDRFQPSERVTSHRVPRRVWRSCVYNDCQEER